MKKLSSKWTTIVVRTYSKSLKISDSITSSSVIRLVLYGVDVFLDDRYFLFSLIIKPI